jgi:hypothetical protein
MKIKKEFNFVLPKTIKSDSGDPVKITGTMRLIKTKEMMRIFHDMRVKESSSYFYIVILNMVVTKLSHVRSVTAKEIENLSPENFAFLVDLFNEINHSAINSVPVICSNCNAKYIGEVALVGEV